MVRHIRDDLPEPGSVRSSASFKFDKVDSRRLISANAYVARKNTFPSVVGGIVLLRRAKILRRLSKHRSRQAGWSLRSATLEGHRWCGEWWSSALLLSGGAGGFFLLRDGVPPIR